MREGPGQLAGARGGEGAAGCEPSSSPTPTRASARPRAGRDGHAVQLAGAAAAKLARASYVHRLRGGGRRAAPGVQPEQASEVASAPLGLSRVAAAPRGWHKVPHWSPGGQGRSVREQRGPCPGVGRRPSVPAQGDAPPARPRVPRGRFSATSRWRTTARSGPARSAASTTAGRPPGRRGAPVRGGRSTGLGAGHRQMPSPLGPVVGDRPGPGRMRGVSRPHGCAAPRLAALGGR